MEHTKANKSKILALILGLTMCIALMLGIVLASPTNTVYAAGETLTPYHIIYINNKPLNNGYYLKTSDGDQLNGDPASGYVAKYNNGVLTLNNFNGGYVGINPGVSGYFTINLIGDNIITGGQNGVFIDGEHEGRVTITSNANGKLTINASSANSVWGIACGASVMAKNIDVVIGGNAQVTINATSNGENKQVQGIHARNVTIEDNASVNITAKNTNSNTESDWVNGVFAKNNVTINTDGNINIDVTQAGGDRAFSYGIRAQGNVTFPKITDMTIKWEKGSGNGLPISPRDEVDSTTHAINEDRTNCFASYRYGTPRYVLAANGTLAGPGVPDYLNYGSGYFLAGDLVTLNAPSLQVSETDMTNIPFDKWFSFASDAVITNATSQNGAKVTVQDKDIEVRANYNAFTAQPVFERESDTKGTVTFTLISNGFNQGRWLKIRPINDLTISKGNVVSVDGTTYKATLENNGTYYGTPAGEYVVEVEYNNTTLYSEPFTIDYTERKAAVDSVTIFGEKGETIASTDITVTLTGYTFATALSGNWITNLPAGLIQTAKRISDTEAKITVSGTPTALSDQVVEITIPKANITGLASDLTVESNSDAKFNIVTPLTKIAVPKAKTGLSYTAGSQTGVDDGVGYTLTGNKGVVAKNYTAIAKLKSGYKWNDGTITDKEIPWSIGKRTPITIDFNFNEPSNLTYDGNAKTATVSLIAHYGDETGYTVTVKYKKGGVIVAEVKDAGEYEVYIDTTATANFNSATDIHDVSWKFTIAKAEQSAPSASLFTTVAPTTMTTTDGKITGITAQMEYRKVGDSAWTSGTGSDVTGLSSGSYQIRFKETVNYNAGAVTEVVVPESGVSSYNLTVTGGTGGGVFIQGTSVTITANDPTIGQRFTGWTIEGISGLDTTQRSLTFNMPANAVTATANYEDIEYTVTVNGGTVDKAKAKYGETVTITATVPTGKKFVEWTSESGSIFTDKTNVTTTFTMPAEDVTVEATFEDEMYRVDVINGTATPETAKYQEEVTVKANEPDTDMYFNKWEVTGLDTTGMDLTKTEIKFNMPAGNVTFKATYLSVPKYGIIMVDGTKDKEVAKEGETITITANPAPTGKVFDKWTCETAGVTIEFKSATSSTTTFVMPAKEIEIKAHFRDVGDAPSIEIKVNGGTGAGVVKKGESITVTANDPAEGKVFKGWQDESGEIVSTEKSYKFTVSEEKTLTAVYGDKPSGGGEITPPAKKDGLSGGQIAGIVIGSVLLAGIGGFAVLWFAVKKKTFADLGIVLKKGFTAIGNFFKNLGAKIKALFTKKK